MEQKTTCILLQCIKYRDNAFILHVYSRHFGRESFALYSGKSRRSFAKNAYLQPLSVLEITFQRRHTQEIQRLTDIRPHVLFSDLICNPVKSTIALFLSEVLFRLLRDTQKEERLYDFLENSIRILDLSEGKIANFHIAFLVQLTRYLGYFPNIRGYEEESNCYFDLLNGVFCREKPLTGSVLSIAETDLFRKIIRMSYENMSYYRFSHQERGVILRQILHYYRLHHVDFQEIRSLEMFQTVFE